MSGLTPAAFYRAAPPTVAMEATELRKLRHNGSTFIRHQVMSVIDELRALQSAQLEVDGEPEEAEFAAGISEAEIEAVEREAGGHLPADYRTLLGACAGIDNSYLETDFTGKGFMFGMEDMRLTSVVFATDGCGNHYVADWLPGEEEVRVFFWCHDPPATVFQCTGMAAWLREFRTQLQPGVSMEAGPLYKVMETATFDVYNTPNHPLTKESMLASGDPELVALAETLEGEGWEAVDLRDPRPGDGFAWARYGTRGDPRRSPTARIFAIQKPPPKKGLFSFLKRQ